jgi:hypothetical protein
VYSLVQALSPHLRRAELCYLRAGCLAPDCSDWDCLHERPPPLRRGASLRVATRINAARFPSQNELVRHSARSFKTLQRLSEFHLAVNGDARGALASQTGPGLRPLTAALRRGPRLRRIYHCHTLEQESWQGNLGSRLPTLVSGGLGRDAPHHQRRQSRKSKYRTTTREYTIF